MSERYLIFGNGFIAEHYAQFLLAQRGKKTVRVLFHNKKNPRLNARIQFKASSQSASITDKIQSFDPHFVILTQGLSFIPDNEKELERSVASNVIAPLVVLEALYKLKLQGKLGSIKKILTFGSAAEYGDSDTKKWSESARDTHPRSLYGLVKHWLFESAHFYADLGLPCVHLRHFNAMGAGQDPRFVVSSFCRQVARIEKGKQKPELVVGDISQKRDFIDIRDAIGAYELVLRKAHRGQIINICSGIAHPVKDVIENLRELTEKKFTVTIDKKLFAHKRTRDKTLVGSPLWLRNNGWKPRYSLSETLAWTLAWWRVELASKK